MKGYSFLKWTGLTVTLMCLCGVGVTAAADTLDIHKAGLEQDIGYSCRLHLADGTSEQVIITKAEYADFASCIGTEAARADILEQCQDGTGGFSRRCSDRLKKAAFDRYYGPNADPAEAESALLKAHTDALAEGSCVSKLSRAVSARLKKNYSGRQFVQAFQEELNERRFKEQFNETDWTAQISAECRSQKYQSAVDLALKQAKSEKYSYYLPNGFLKGADGSGGCSNGDEVCIDFDPKAYAKEGLERSGSVPQVGPYRAPCLGFEGKEKACCGEAFAAYSDELIRRAKQKDHDTGLANCRHDIDHGVYWGTIACHWGGNSPIALPLNGFSFKKGCKMDDWGVIAPSFSAICVGEGFRQACFENDPEVQKQLATNRERNHRRDAARGVAGHEHGSDAHRAHD